MQDAAAERRRQQHGVPAFGHQRMLDAVGGAEDRFARFASEIKRTDAHFHPRSPRSVGNDGHRRIVLQRVEQGQRRGIGAAVGRAADGAETVFLKKTGNDSAVFMQGNQSV